MTKQCFVICPFGEPNSDTRNRSDSLLEYVIKPAVTEMGYVVSRADFENYPGIVTDHVIQHLCNDDLVIADLTGGNPNVFYELAIRHAVQKPCIQLLQAGQPMPFNIQTMQTISYELGRPEENKTTIEKIKNQIRYFDENREVSNPIVAAVGRILGDSSEQPDTERSLVVVEDVDWEFFPYGKASFINTEEKRVGENTITYTIKNFGGHQASNLSLSIVFGSSKRFRKLGSVTWANNLRPEGSWSYEVRHRLEDNEMEYDLEIDRLDVFNDVWIYLCFLDLERGRPFYQLVILNYQDAVSGTKYTEEFWYTSLGGKWLPMSQEDKLKIEDQARAVLEEE